MPLLPAQVQLRIRESENCVEIRIAPNKRWFLVVFAPFLLIFGLYFYFLLMPPRELYPMIIREMGGPGWLLLNGAVAALVLARIFLIQESVVADSAALSITTGIGPIARTRKFAISEVQNLRPIAGLRRIFTIERIAFDCDGKPHFLGERLEEDDVKAIVLALKRRLPQA